MPVTHLNMINICDFLFPDQFHSADMCQSETYQELVVQYSLPPRLPAVVRVEDLHVSFD